MIPQPSNSKKRPAKMSWRRRRAKHRRAEAEETRKWRRRALGLGLLGLMLVAGVALAFLFSRKDSAPDSFTAAAIGEVDIGQLETNGFFGDLQALQPGEALESCVSVNVDTADATGPGDFRLYVADFSDAGLADHLEVTIQHRDSVGATNWGIPCENFTDLLAADPVFDGTLTGLAAVDSYEDAFQLRIIPPSAGANNAVEVRLAVTLPETAPQAVSGTSAAVAFAFENR